jgi:hypothetical protein
MPSATTMTVNKTNNENKIVIIVMESIKVSQCNDDDDDKRWCGVDSLPRFARCYYESKVRISHHLFDR